MPHSHTKILRDIVKVVNESAFNLRKGAKVNDDDFDNDEVSTEDI